MKEKFIQLLEEQTWNNEHLKWLACKVIPLHIPEYFWTVPSSITGKYHPIDSLGEGGLVRHTIKVINMGLKLASANPKMNYDEVIIACAFHDITKYGSNAKVSDNRNDFFIHPRTAKKYLWDIFDMNVFPGGNDDDVAELIECELVVCREDYRTLVRSWERICNAVESHYAIWGKEQGLPMPTNQLDFIVSHADLIASMKEYIDVEYRDPRIPA